MSKIFRRLLKLGRKKEQRIESKTDEVLTLVEQKINVCKVFAIEFTQDWKNYIKKQKYTDGENCVSNCLSVVGIVVFHASLKLCSLCPGVDGSNPSAKRKSTGKNSQRKNQPDRQETGRYPSAQYCH